MRGFQRISHENAYDRKMTELWINPGSVIGENFVGGAGAFLGSAFHIALVVDGAMFSGEVNGALTHPLVASKASILPDTPAGIATQEIGISRGKAQRSPASVVGTDPRNDTLQLLKAALIRKQEIKL